MRPLPLAGPLVSAVSVAAGGVMAGLHDPALVLVLFVLVAFGTAVGTRRMAVASLSDAERTSMARRSTAVALGAGATIVVVLVALASMST